MNAGLLRLRVLKERQVNVSYTCPHAPRPGRFLKPGATVPTQPAAFCNTSLDQEQLGLHITRNTLPFHC